MAEEPKQTQRHTLERKPDGTLMINIIVPAAEVEAAREKIVSELVKQVELPGFRKGAAPRKISEEKLNKQSVQEEVLKKVLSEEYVAAVKQLAINPIVNPRVHVEQFTDGTNLEFTAETCEQPLVELKNYKDEIKKVTAASKLVIPGKSEDKKVGLDQILNAALSTAKIQIPKILIDQETDRLLSQLLDELKSLGVTLDQYLASRNKTGEQLRAEYIERAEKDLKLEFMLRRIADEEKITVEQSDIEKALGEIKDEKQKKDVASNPYLVAAIIRQQKTLDYLAKL